MIVFREGRKERERDIYLLFHLFMHSVVGISGWCSNQLSYRPGLISFFSLLYTFLKVLIVNKTKRKKKALIFTTSKSTFIFLLGSFIKMKKTLSFLKFYLLFWERGREGERAGEKHQCFSPQLGTWPETQACALTGNRTGNFWFAGPHSIYWATPARARRLFSIIVLQKSLWVLRDGASLSYKSYVC